MGLNREQKDQLTKVRLIFKCDLFGRKRREVVTASEPLP